MATHKQRKSGGGWTPRTPVSLGGPQGPTVMIEPSGDLNKLIRDFMNVGNIPDDVQKEMVTRKAKVVEEAERYTAQTMLRGPYNKGAVADAVKARKARKVRGGVQATVTFKGKQHGTRLGEIAFLNQYGTTKQRPRPFIRTAIARWGYAATEEAYKVMVDWMAKNDL